MLTVQSIMEKAKAGSLVTGDRFVPGRPGPNSRWCVIDAHLENVIESGLTFDVALDHAERFSRLDKVQHEDAYRNHR